MKGPKVTVIGAGSYFFGKPVIHKMATSEIMKGGTLALVDTDKKVLDTMMTLAAHVIKETKCGVKLIGSTDRKEVMKDSNFIVLTFSERNAYYRGVDTKIAKKHGITMCSSDTIGPGGIFRAMREIPHALAVAKDAEKIAPDAWIINFINPTTVLGMALRRYAPKMRSFALCDGNHEPYNTRDRFLKVVGILPQEATVIPSEVYRKLDLAIGGVNHCTWMTRFIYDKKDMMPAFQEYIVKKVKEESKNPGEKSKSRYNWACAIQLFDLYGAYPTAVSHTKEYVPFFQGYGVAKNVPEPIITFDADNRAREMAAAWATTEKYAKGELDVPHFLKNTANDHATDIIESMWGNLGKSFYINSPNQGAVTNLPYDAFLELRCHVDMKGVRPLHFGEIPRGVLAIQHQLLDTHEMTAEAAVTGDRALLRRAMLTDPICNNIPDADNCIAELLAAEKDVLPEYWY